MDKVFRDDECRVRTDNAPANFATCRHIAYNLTPKAPGKDSIRGEKPQGGTTSISPALSPRECLHPIPLPFERLRWHLQCAARIAIVWQIRLQPSGVFAMTQTSNRFFDEIGRLMNDAAGAAQGVKREVDTVVRNQAEKILRDLDVVKREEFEVVKDMARLAREENEALKARIAVLEAKLGLSPSAPDNGSLKTDG
jgi:BMFP domain-containing protein YqiC